MKKEFCLVELSISAFGESTIGTVISLHTTEKSRRSGKEKEWFERVPRKRRKKNIASGRYL